MFSLSTIALGLFILVVVVWAAKAHRVGMHGSFLSAFIGYCRIIPIGSTLSFYVFYETVLLFATDASPPRVHLLKCNKLDLIAVYDFN